MKFNTDENNYLYVSENDCFVLIDWIKLMYVILFCFSTQMALLKPKMKPLR